MLRTSSTKFVSLGLMAAASVALLTGCAGSGTGSASPSTASASSSPSASSVALPSSFPKSVPLVAGDVDVASGNANDGWSVTVSPKGSTGYAQAEQALAKAGFTKQAGSTDTHATFENADYTIGLSTPGQSVTYIVSTR